MWLETSAEVYAVIMAKHRKDFSVHSSFSDPDGFCNDFSAGKPEMVTEWGFKSSETPLLKIVQSKKDKDQKEWDSNFFIKA